MSDSYTLQAGTAPPVQMPHRSRAPSPLDRSFHVQPAPSPLQRLERVRESKVGVVQDVIERGRDARRRSTFIGDVIQREKHLLQGCRGPSDIVHHWQAFRAIEADGQAHRPRARSVEAEAEVAVYAASDRVTFMWMRALGIRDTCFPYTSHVLGGTQSLSLDIWMGGMGFREAPSDRPVPLRGCIIGCNDARIMKTRSESSEVGGATSCCLRRQSCIRSVILNRRFRACLLSMVNTLVPLQATWAAQKINANSCSPE